MTDATQLTLARHDTDSIEALWRVAQALPAKSRLLEVHVESDALRGALGAVLGQPAWLVAALLEAVLAERGSFEVVDEPIAAAALSESNEAVPPRVEFKATRSIGMAAPELVWSGDTAARSCARLTREAIEDLFGAVETEVFIAGFSFDHASDLFAPLFDQVRALVNAGRAMPRIRVVLDCSREKWRSGDTPQTIAGRVQARFLDTCWRDAPVKPEIRYLRKSAERKPDGFAEFSMHAKCIVVDRDRVLVGSANFSNRGRDKNLEVGAIIRDYHFVQSLCAEWEALWPELVAVDAAASPVRTGSTDRDVTR